MPWSIQQEIKSLIGSSGTIERPWASGDRFSLATGIAARVRQVAADTSRTIPSAVLVANGADTDTFFDALSASAVSANTDCSLAIPQSAFWIGSNARSWP